ncbi:MAG: exodeoxyribonuclease VII small subunit [Actinomycetota bacterium]|nr:exodeoxyribonuclease VII small subunit [Actinomycetota bacterium]
MTDHTADAQPADVQPADEQTYEQARDELVDVVRNLEAGGTSLADSLALWERGEHLAGVCQRWLDGARARLDAASNAPESDPGPTPESDSASTAE